MPYFWDIPPYGSGGALLLDTDLGRFLIRRVRRKSQKFEVYLNGKFLIGMPRNATRDTCKQAVEEYLTSRGIT